MAGHYYTSHLWTLRNIEEVVDSLYGSGGMSLCQGVCERASSGLVLVF